MLRTLRYYANGLRSNRQALPQVLLIGAQKAATSSLYQYLATHSQICQGKKEIDFFTVNYERGINYYKRQFPFSNKITIDASPRYIYDTKVPERVAQMMPSDIKIIVSLRDPVRRAFSAWNMYKQICQRPEIVERFKLAESKNAEFKLYSEYCKGYFPSFQDCVRRELDWINTGNIIVEPSLIRRGFYLEQIKRWLQFFPKENFFFVNSQALSNEVSAKEILLELEGFIGINQGELKNLDFGHHHKRKYSSPISEDLVSELKILYQEKNQGLEELTGLNFSWL